MSPRVLVTIAVIVLVIAIGTIVGLKRSVQKGTTAREDAIVNPKTPAPKR